VPDTSMQATWVDPSGVEWPLTDTSDSRGYFTRTDIAGWGARAYELVTDPVAGGGESVRFIRANPARITWPLYIRGDTHLEFLQRWRDLRAAFMSTLWKGQTGTLRVTRGDGTAREIDCFLEDGFQGQGGENWLYANAVLTLYAPEGSWRDTAVVNVPRSYTPGSDFLNPFPTISSSQILGRVPIDNAGELPAWPSWLITGPATVVTATNWTTSQSWVLTTTLAAGETATINTLPRPTARGPVGQNLVGSFNWPDAYLWPLVSGTNDVEFVVAGASTGTSIQMVYQARYEGA
jgi:hypothetical protein